ncbi:MAG: DUF1566 domain-containing protein, partial [Arcobacteraceae bacterium]|nr:DUF1566 domain-containing protein [Arcobacteraceae bacterium]
DGNNTYKIIIKATDEVGNEINQTISVTIIDDDEEINLYITNIVYDNNLTDNNVSDDITYIYFSKLIDTDSLDLNNINNMFNINGDGNFTDANATYSKDLFNSIKIYQNSNSSALIPNDTNISIKPNTIKDKCGAYPTDFNQTVVSNIKYILKTEQNLDGYTNSGLRSSGNFYDDGHYDIGMDRNYTRDDINGTVMDNITNLMWQDDTNNTHTYSGSNTYCSNLILDGFNDWRLANITELSNILSYKRFINKWLPSNSFLNHKEFKYWSSTPTTGILGSNKAWYVDFDNNMGIVTYTDPNTLMYIKCIRNF